MTAAHHRMGFIGGSDAKRIIEGDWLALYEEKVGIRQPEDLSGIFRVQLGVFTEPFHRDWLNTHVMPDDYAEPCGQLNHPKHPWMVAHFDGWLRKKQTFIELKHTNARASVRSMSEDYQPQIAHYCAVAGKPFGYLSFIAGNDDPVVCKVEPSPEYINQLVELEKAFWWHVENKVAPDAPDTSAIEKAAKAVKVDGMRFVDMTGNNEWASHAADYLANMVAADAFETAKASLKKLVEADVAEASGHGITIKKDKRGALRFSLEKELAA